MRIHLRGCVSGQRFCRYSQVNQTTFSDLNHFFFIAIIKLSLIVCLRFFIKSTIRLHLALFIPTLTIGRIRLRSNSVTISFSFRKNLKRRLVQTTQFLVVRSKLARKQKLLDVSLVLNLILVNVECLISFNFMF